MKNFLTMFFTVVTVTLFSQSFEGRITYQNNYQSNIPNVSDAQFTAMMGSVQEFLIKGGDYTSSADGKVFQWQLYKNRDNKLYTKMSNSETILWNDGGINPDSVLSVTLNKGVTEILGLSCDELILTCKTGIQKYYFSSTLAVDAALYKNHLYGNWYDFVSVSKALPLKYIIENQQFTLTTIATAIKEMKLGDSIFQLPVDAKVAKSPY